MIFCKTPNCAMAKTPLPIELEGKPCPLCQNTLEVVEKISEEEKQLIASLPYLIAYPLENTLLEEHPWTKVNLLKDTLLNYLKFLGLLAASEFFNSPFKDKNIISSFYKNLAHPSFGSWNAFTRETIQFLKENKHDFFCPELHDYYEKIETGKKRKLYNGEIEIIDARGEIEITKQQATGIGMLINFRNRYLGHGLTLDAKASEKLWDQYYPIFKELLEKLQWCKDYVFYKNEGKNTWKLLGSKIKQVEVSKAEDNVWIQNKDGEKINLVPFFIIPGEVALDDTDTKMLTYESFTGKSIKFFSPEGIDKTTSGRVLESLNLIIKNKQEETPFSPEQFTKEILLDRIEKENQFVLQTLIDERKVINGIYQNREDVEVKLRSWIGSIASVFFIAAEAGSGKTNLLVEIQRQYKARELSTLLIRASRMAKKTLKQEICYLLNIDENKALSDYQGITWTQSEPVFILIDGINESAEEQTIWKEIKELSQEFKSGALKFVVTCRVNSKEDLDRFKIDIRDKDILYTENQDEITVLSDAVTWLTPFNMVELENTWNSYTTKNKKFTKPQFKFKDIGDYDRGFYEKIKNPLILRIFLETYHNKPLPKKGKRKLNIWKDWLDTFKKEEITLLKLLATEIWEQDKNELELEALLNNDEIEAYITDTKVNAPYNRLVTMGWLSRYNNSNTVFISITVEGLLFYLLGEYLATEKKVTVELIEQYIDEKSVVKKSTVESYLISCADKNETALISDLIDHSETTLEITIPALTEYAKTFGAEKTIETLFDNPTDLDWLALKKLVYNLDELLLKKLKKEILLVSKKMNTLSNENQILLGFKTLGILDKIEKTEFFNKFNVQNQLFHENDNLLFSLADFYDSIEEYDKALEYYEKSLTIILKVHGDQHSLAADAFNKLGIVYRTKGEYDKAIEFYDKALAIRLKVLGDQHPSTGISYNNLGLVYKFQGKYDKAIEFYDMALAIKLRVHGNQHPSTGNTYGNFGSVYMSKEEYSRAIEYFDKALAIRLKVHGDQHPSTGASYGWLGSVYWAKGEYDKAIEYHEKSLAILLKVHGDQHTSTGTSYNSLGNSYKEKKQYSTAKQYFQKAHDIFLKILGAEHKHTKLLSGKLKEIDDL